MTNDQTVQPANPAKAKRMLDNIRERYARGREALRAEREDPAMTTTEFATARGVPVQQIRRDKQFAEQFSLKDVERVCQLWQPDGMPLQWGHIAKVLAVDPGERLMWLKRAAEHGWPADVRSRQIVKDRGARSGHGRSIQRPPTVEDGLDQLARDGDLWLRRYLLLVEQIDEEAGAERRSKTPGDALHALLETADTRKERREWTKRLRPATEERAAVLVRLRDCCRPAAVRPPCAGSAKFPGSDRVRVVAAAFHLLGVSKYVVSNYHYRWRREPWG
jgi:hypothetical protein